MTGGVGVGGITFLDHQSEGRNFKYLWHLVSNQGKVLGWVYDLTNGDRVEGAGLAVK